MHSLFGDAQRHSSLQHITDFKYDSIYVQNLIDDLSKSDRFSISMTVVDLICFEKLGLMILVTITWIY